MKAGGVVAPLVAAALGLGGALASTLALHHAASGALDRVLEERLRGAGEAAAVLLADGPPPDGRRLGAVMRANDLDGAYLLAPSLRVTADATGPSGRRADLLRLDAGRVAAAFSGAAGVAPGYALGTLTVMTGYFPVRAAGAAVSGVLVLEAGRPFVAAHARVARARAFGLSLSLLSALALALVAARWTRAERERQQAATRAARGETLSRVAAMAAHEIRNPLGVIRGTIELMRERSATALSARDREALGDVVAEVERLRVLTQELLDLASDRPLALAPTDLAPLLLEAARAAEASFPEVTVRCAVAPLPVVDVDAAKLRQVFANLLSNAAQSQGRGEIALRAAPCRDGLRITVEDHGPGVAPEAGERLFELYFTTKSGGTGLGLAVARRLVERHGGTLAHLPDRGPGATFEVTIPARTRAPAGAREG